MEAGQQKVISGVGSVMNGDGAIVPVGVVANADPTLQDEIKELGWEAVRFVAGIAATVIATRIVWHFMNPFRKEEEKAEANRAWLLSKLGDDFEEQLEETDQYEDQIASGLVVPADMTVRFSDIAGLAELKQNIRELVILPFQRPDLFRPGSLVGPPKGVLLYGPPGTGKTMLAKAIAKEISDCRFLNVSLSTLQSQWFGESQSLVKATFSLARKLAPCIIFIDEIDSFMRNRRRDDHQAVSDMRAEFMAQWDGMETDPRLHVMVLGTTNKKDEIDPAMLRRMPRRFEVPLPTKDHRAQILETVLRNESLEPNFDFELIAARTTGYSGSELADLCKAGLVHGPMREFIDSKEKGALRGLSTEDVIAGLSSVKPAADFQDEEEEFADANEQPPAVAMMNQIAAMAMLAQQAQQQAQWGQKQTQ